VSVFVYDVPYYALLAVAEQRVLAVAAVPILTAYNEH
jgi:hypothetical protein